MFTDVPNHLVNVAFVNAIDFMPTDIPNHLVNVAFVNAILFTLIYSLQIYVTRTFQLSNNITKFR